MAQQTLSAGRVIDPVITQVARGYRPQADYVAPFLFPTVNVGLRAGRILSFGAEHFKLFNTIRAPGAKTGRTQFGYSSGTYSLVDRSLEGAVPIELLEEGRNGPGIDHLQYAIRRVQEIMALEQEHEAATLARTAANYGTSTETLSGTSQWSDSTSDPVAKVEAAKEVIRSKTGMVPNQMVIGPAVAVALRTHAKILDRIKYTGRDVPTLELFASLFGVQNVRIGGGVYQTDSDNAAFVDVWGKDVVLAYSNVAPAASLGDPSFGYTYQLTGYPFAEEAYFERNEKTWYAPYTDSRQVQLVGASAGYLIKNAVA